MSEMATPAFSPEYVALLRLAYFLGKEPIPRVDAIKACLERALVLCPSDEEAILRVELGNLFFYRTSEKRKAKEHFERAHHLDRAKFNPDVVIPLSQIYISENAFDAAISLLQGGPRNRQRVCATLLLAKAYTGKGDFEVARETYRLGGEAAEKLKSNLSSLLCLMGEAQCLIAQEKHTEAQQILNRGLGCVAACPEGNEKARLSAAFATLMALSFLLTGQVKEAKKYLKQLQQLVAVVSQSGGSSIYCEWMESDSLIIMVYLVHVLYCFLSGSTSKALTYADKAFDYFKNLKEETSFTIKLKSHIYHYKALCQLIRGKYTLAVNDISQLFHFCSKSVDSSRHLASLRLLLGLYALLVEQVELADGHLLAVLQISEDSHLQHIALLNLIAQRLRGRRFNDAMALIAKAEQSQIGVAHRIGIDYVKGLTRYLCSGRLEDSRSLHEALVKANEGELKRMTSSSLSLLGQIFMRHGNTEHAEKMLFPAFDEAHKIPDSLLELRCLQLIEMFYVQSRNMEKACEVGQRKMLLAQQLDRERREALQRPEHSFLIQWMLGSNHQGRDGKRVADKVETPTPPKKEKRKLSRGSPTTTECSA